MFHQENAYIPTEYGTRSCKEYREPCGAFYGLPFSGEITGQFLPEQEQIQAQVSSRYFSKRDELTLAHLRGEWLDEQPEVDNRVPMRDDPEIVRSMVTEFRNDTQAPTEVVKEYLQLARRYAKGERYLLANLHDMYTRWINRKYE